jgi:outer membrane receptor protein involved in Fe transport
MFAADPPALVQPSETDPHNVIEIVGTRPGQAQKIDRRSYRVKETPQSAQFNGIQLLRGLPAVTITPDDQIMLLGAPGVTILVDERPVSVDPILYLRTLHGSDIERIEIMTNPSAQYAAGTAGIINFVLRKKRQDGVSGSGNVELASRGNVQSGTTIKRKQGKWTYELQAQGKAGRTSESTYLKLRSTQQFQGGPSTINEESGGGHSSQRHGSLNGKLIYDIGPRTSVTGDLFAVTARSPQTNRANFDGLTGDFEPFSERSNHTGKFSWVRGGVALDHKGRKEGETLKASAGIDRTPSQRHFIRAELGDATGFYSARDQESSSAYLSTDWVRPIGKHDILSVGASINGARHSHEFRFSSSDQEQYGPDFDDSFAVQERSASAYGTFQHPFGSWTVMPGLRFDGLWRKFSSPGRASTEIRRAKLSPTLHIEHPLSKTVKMVLSYSKRFNPPGPEQLRPYSVVVGPLSVEQGNPRLKEQVTDAYEVNLHYSRKSVQGGLILYNRRTTGAWFSEYSVNEEGLNVLTPVNIGDRHDRGAQFDLSTPLIPRVKGNASVNLFSTRVPILTDTGVSSASMFRYTGNATVEWQGRERGNIPGDIAQAQLTYIGPTREYQFRRDNYLWLSLSYTRSLSSTFSVTANVVGLGSTRTGHRLVAPLVQEIYERRERPEFKVKLVKTIGSATR